MTTTTSAGVLARFGLGGRTALVTGSSRGIGREFALALAGAGARVVVHGRDPTTVETARIRVAAVARAAEAPPPVGIVFDVTDAEATEAAFARLDEEVGSVDILVGNAGVQHREPMTDVALADFERVLRTNLVGAFSVARSAARRMLPRGHGKIVNVASVQAELARPSIGAYAASKGGLRMLTKAMCAEWAGGGVTVNALAPGYIVTELTQPLVDDPTFDSWIRGRTPAGRWGQVDDLVGPLLWLCSPASDFVNGQTVFVDGGMTAVV